MQLNAGPQSSNGSRNGSMASDPTVRFTENAADVGAAGELFMKRGIPEHIGSDNGPEFTVEAVRDWLSR